MTHLIGYTDRERELVDAWKSLVEKGLREGLDEKVAIQLGISPVTVRTRKSRLRSKYDQALRFCQQYRSDQQYLFQKTGGKVNPLGRSGKKGK